MHVFTRLLSAIIILSTPSKAFQTSPPEENICVPKDKVTSPLVQLENCQLYFQVQCAITPRDLAGQPSCVIQTANGQQTVQSSPLIQIASTRSGLITVLILSVQLEHNGTWECSFQGYKPAQVPVTVVDFKNTSIQLSGQNGKGSLDSFNCSISNTNADFIKNNTNVTLLRDGQSEEKSIGETHRDSANRFTVKFSTQTERERGWLVCRVYIITKTCTGLDVLYLDSNIISLPIVTPMPFYVTQKATNHAEMTNEPTQHDEKQTGNTTITIIISCTATISAIAVFIVVLLYRCKIRNRHSTLPQQVTDPSKDSTPISIVLSGSNSEIQHQVEINAKPTSKNHHPSEKKDAPLNCNISYKNAD